jgi:hypothetical protein
MHKSRPQGKRKDFDSMVAIYAGPFGGSVIIWGEQEPPVYGKYIT